MESAGTSESLMKVIRKRVFGEAEGTSLKGFIQRCKLSSATTKDKFYDTLHTLLRRPRSSDIAVILGDLNALSGSETHLGGQHELDSPFEAGPVSQLAMAGNTFRLMSILLQEVLRGVDGKYHSIATEVSFVTVLLINIQILPLLLDLICGISVDRNMPISSTRIKRSGKSGLNTILKSAISKQNSVAESSQPTQADPQFVASIPQLTSEVLSSLTENFLSPDQLSYTTKLLLERFELLKARLTETAFEDLVQILKRLLDSLRLDIFSQLEENFGHVLTTQLYSIEQRMNFILMLADWDLFDRDVFPNLGSFFCQLPQCDNVNGHRSLSSATLFGFLLKLCILRRPPPPEPFGVFSVDSAGCCSFTLREEQGKIDLRSSSAISADSTPVVVNLILSAISNAFNADRVPERDASEWFLAYCLTFLNPLPLEHVSAVLCQASHLLVTQITSNTPDGSISTNQLLLLTSLLVFVETRSQLFPSGGQYSQPTIPFGEVPVDVLLRLARAQCLTDPDVCCIALRISDIVCCTRALVSSEQRTMDPDPTAVSDLLPCLMSPSHQVRLHALRLLLVLSKAVTLDGTSTSPGDASLSTVSVLTRCLRAEKINLHPQNVREFLVPVLHMHAHRNGIRDLPSSAQIALHHLLGLLHVPLTSAWPGIQEAIASFAELPVSTSKRDTHTNSSVGVDEERSQWSYVARQLYWTVVEPVLKEANGIAIENSQAAQSLAEKPIDPRDPFSRFLQRFRWQPDKDYLPFETNQNVDFRSINWPVYHLSLWRCLRPISACQKSRLISPLALKIIHFGLEHGFTRSGEELLIVVLDLFSKFPNLKSICQEVEFRTALYELLTNKRPTIQSAAFKCLLAYKNPALNTYRDQLERIIEMKTFRDEIRTFKLDTAVQNTAHRAHVAPVFLRILYGRLQLSKNSFAPAIFTNLATCSFDEFSSFLNLLFAPLLSISISGSQTSTVGVPQDSNELIRLINDLQDRVKQSCLVERTLNWSKLQALSKVLNHVLDYMGHRLGAARIALNHSDDEPSDTSKIEHVDILLRLGLCLIAMVQAAKDAKSSSTASGVSRSGYLPLGPQMKRIRSTGVRLLEHLFSSDLLQSNGFWGEHGRLDAVQHVCLQPSIMATLLTSSSVSTNHLLLTLALPWSSSASLAAALMSHSVLETLLKLLCMPKLNSAVAERLIEIVSNLIFLPDVQLIGRKLLLPFHAHLIRYMSARLEHISNVKTLKFFEQKHGSLRLQREFRILTFLATPAETDDGTMIIVSPKEADHLLHGLLSLLTRTSIRRKNPRKRIPINSDNMGASLELQLATEEVVEAELVKCVTQLIRSADNLEKHLVRILNLFSRLDSRICRSLLCQAVGVGISRIPAPLHDLFERLCKVSREGGASEQLPTYLDTLRQSDKTLGHLCEDLLSRLNSWDQSRLDQPDSLCREHAFGVLMELAHLLETVKLPEQTLYLHLGGLNCALHTLCRADLQLRDAALEYCLSVSKAVESCRAETPSYHRALIIGCLWPGLLRALRDPLSAGPKRMHLLKLLSGIVHVFRKHPRFAPLSLLTDSNSPTADFFASLQSGTVTRQSQAMRRLALFLRNPLTISAKRQLATVRTGSQLKDSDFVIPERDLCNLFLPLVQFYLDPQIHSSVENISLVPEQKRLLEHCVDAVGALASHFSWNNYQKLLRCYLSRLKTTSNTSFVARVITVIIDAFRPPAWPQSTKKTVLEVEETQGNVPQPCPMDSSVDCNSVLTYMLEVVRLLQPFISKPHRAALVSKDADKSISKSFRISLIVSLVSLLRRLPSGYLESRLPSLILSVVNVLRPSPNISPQMRSEAIRSLTRVARMLGLGKPLDTLVSVVSQQLGRGYAAQQIRLFTLHKILSEVESAIISGEIVFRPGDLDAVGKILSSHYVDELVGSLAEEMDSRRSAGQSLSTIHPSRSHTDSESFSAANLGGKVEFDLPEANGIKAPDGLTRLCRLLSPDGLLHLFEAIQSAVSSAATGKALKDDDGLSDVSATGCGLRFRNRALARVEVALARLPTRNGMFTKKQSGTLQPECLLRLASELIGRNITQVLSVDHPEEQRNEAAAELPNKRMSEGWMRPRSKLLEPRWNYLDIEAEPTRERGHLSEQSELTQAHLLVSCGLHILVGLLRYGWLKRDQSKQMNELANCIPLILDCMRSKYVRVLGGALRCLNLLFIICANKPAPVVIPNFSGYLDIAGKRLFELLTTHPGILSTKTAATDVYAQQFASNLYRALAALVRHQAGYTLSRSQLLTLLNAVDIEITKDSATAPSLSLLQAILQRRLRDPNLQKEELDFLTLTGDPEMQQDVTASKIGLTVARSTDRDYSEASGAGGGTRLLDLIERLQHLAITSTSEKIRADARCCLVTFLLNYPHKAKFVQSFVAFCLRQLEYNKPTGRLSAVSLLTGLVSDLPIGRLVANSLDEAILVSVGAAIEREPVRSLRVGMLALIRVLFTRLSPEAADSHFNDYLLAFLSAPAASRCSARLLGLQLISAVLDCQHRLSQTRYRPVLLKLLGTDTIPSAAAQLCQFVLGSRKIRASSGLDPLFEGGLTCPADEIAAAQAAVEDAEWVAGLSSDPLAPKSDSEQKTDDEETLITMENEEDIEVSVESEDSDVEREQTHFEAAEEDARIMCDRLLTTSRSSARKLCKSAVENQYFLVACTLEHALKLVYRLLAPASTSSVESTDSSFQLSVSPAVTSIWQALLRLSPSTGLGTGNLPGEITHSRTARYSTLFSVGKAPKGSSVSELEQLSLLCAGHREARQWSSRCLALLLRVEVSANETLLANKDADSAEAVGCKTKCAFFREIRKKRKLRTSLLQRLMQDCLFQLEHDAKDPLPEDWSDSLIANLVQLAQLLHLEVGRKPVLKLFRAANRIALDELNNRPHCYIQRTLTLKLITTLLMRLPHPQPEELAILLKSKPSVETGPAQEQDSEGLRAPAYIAYIRAASRQLAREFRQRERLVFMAASSLMVGQDEEVGGSDAARARLGGIKLSKELSARARVRRKKTQARLRRALMSGTIRPETAKHLVASAAASRAHAGPDQLVNMIEATEQSLTESIGGGNRQLIQTVCNQASSVAKAKQQEHSIKKAARAALGVSWMPPNNAPTVSDVVCTTSDTAGRKRVKSSMEFDRAQLLNTSQLGFQK
ncbi:small subunit processome component 20 homolog [Clonorchis sinensis]|uniref:Small subunit processome component 20 homolog n=1 Tax=Clonorchis sinensis TaxID=79923 RepID=H2KR86_CLOSI|nr:small subunit processome component 20 homolog [Clonorchis sinensis]